MQTARFLVDEELPAGLPRLMAGVEAFLQEHGCPPKVAFTVQFAIEEVVTNALTHGAKERRPAVTVALALDDEQVQVEISDDGALFNPLRDAPVPDVKAPLGERVPGGLGLHLLRETMDFAHYSAEGGRNCLTLRKRLDAKADAKAKSGSQKSGSQT